MKTFLLTMVSIFLLMITGAQTAEFLSAKEFQAEKKKLNDGIIAAKKTANDAKKILSAQKHSLDSLSILLSVYKEQMVKSNDSVSILSVKVKDLQNQMEQKKTYSRNQLIFAFGLILVLLLIAFILLFIIKKKSDQNFLSLSEAGEKTKSKIDQGLKMVNEDVRGCKELITATSNELNQQLKTGIGQFEMRAVHLEQKINENTGIIEGKINKTTEENDLLQKKQEDKLNALQSQSDQKIRELTDIVNSVEKHQKGIVPGIMEDIGTLKTQLEDKVKLLTAEISKLKIK
jgi:hypothetical protein